MPPDRLVGSGRIKGMVQLHQALPLVERQHALIEEMRARAPRYVTAAKLLSILVETGSLPRGAISFPGGSG
jgi:hypothetical protein